MPQVFSLFQKQLVSGLKDFQAIQKSLFFKLNPDSSMMDEWVNPTFPLLLFHGENVTSSNKTFSMWVCRMFAGVCWFILS